MLFKLAAPTWKRTTIHVTNTQRGCVNLPGTASHAQNLASLAGGALIVNAVSGDDVQFVLPGDTMFIYIGHCSRNGQLLVYDLEGSCFTMSPGMAAGLLGRYSALRGGTLRIVCLLACHSFPVGLLACLAGVPVVLCSLTLVEHRAMMTLERSFVSQLTMRSDPTVAFHLATRALSCRYNWCDPRVVAARGTKRSAGIPLLLQPVLVTVFVVLDGRSHCLRVPFQGKVQLLVDAMATRVGAVALTSCTVQHRGRILDVHVALADYGIGNDSIVSMLHGLLGGMHQNLAAIGTPASSSSHSQDADPPGPPVRHAVHSTRQSLVPSRLQWGMVVYVVTPTGGRTVVSVSPNERMSSIKEKIEMQIGILASNQTLLFDGLALADESTLADNGVDDEDTINLVASAAGGPSSTAASATKKTRNPSDDACPICCEGFQVGYIIESVCAEGHLFHSACIECWRNASENACPICRQVMF